VILGWFPFGVFGLAVLLVAVAGRPLNDLDAMAS